MMMTSLPRGARCCAIAAALLMGTAPLAEAYQAVAIGSFSSPIDVRTAPGQPANLYVVEQPGKIFVLRNEVRVARPFLDIENQVLFGGEQGLLSMAFAPDYAISGRFYVLFVNNNGNVEVDEFTRSSADPLRATLGSRRVVLRISHPNAGNHNGGQLHFGPDGFLYIAIGDGGNTPTAGEPARDINSLLGKILRINPLAGLDSSYQIPPGNPFVGVAGRDEIYSYGLRNPYRFSMTAGLITIGDVGQARREEVNILKIADANGVNFGWPQFEGDLVYDASLPGPGPATPPIFTYAQTGGACAIIGGHIMRDPDLPELKGRYLYGDFCTGDIRSFKPIVGTQQATGDASLGLTLDGLTSFGLGTRGQIYITAAGTLYRLEP